MNLLGVAVAWAVITAALMLWDHFRPKEED